MGGIVKPWYHEILPSYEKEGAIMQLGWVCRELCWVKLDSLKHLHITLFYLYKIPKRQNYRNVEGTSGSQELRRVETRMKVDVLLKVPCGDGNIVWTDWISVSDILL